MLRKLLLFLVIGSLAASADAQRKPQKTTAYAITAAQKGNSSWTEVRLIDVNSGEVLKTIHASQDEVSTLNARTRKPVVKKETLNTNFATTTRVSASPVIESRAATEAVVARKNMTVRAVELPTTVTAHSRENVIINQNNNLNENVNVTRIITEKVNKVAGEKRILIRRTTENLDKPFSTTSAACAYDKKHERLYYTPMGINELRYIDLKAKTPTIYYYENESFGALSSRHDVPNQVTRMVIGGDGDGYALTNNGNHLIKFSTSKKGEITDLGALTDDAANGRYSVHSSSGYGGDMIADEKDNLYLITAGRSVFKISLNTKVASFIGSIKGLPREFSTNGAAVEKGTSIIVSSANSTLGYYRFDLENLIAEKISSEGAVYNASDLANSNLISVKKKRERDEKKEEPIVDKAPLATIPTDGDVPEILQRNKISVYPNPVAMGGVMRLSFKDQEQGMYTVQFMDITGKLISARQVNISSRQQVEEYALPELTARGNYLLKVVAASKQVVSVNKVVVQ